MPDEENITCGDCGLTFSKEEPHYCVTDEPGVVPKPIKKKFTQTKKGKIVLGVALLLACFWTAYALDYVLNPTEETTTYDYWVSDNCWSEIQIKNSDDSLVYMGFECTPEVTMEEMYVAIAELKRYAQEELGFDDMKFPFVASQLVKKFQNPDEWAKGEPQL